MLLPRGHPLLAEAYSESSQTEEGLRLVAGALATADHRGMPLRRPALNRVKGESLLRQRVPDAPEAEASFRQSLDVARRQQAKSLALRVAMNLSRLWQCQGKRDVGRELPAPIYGWFAEGFDTADLQEAKALLETGS